MDQGGRLLGDPLEPGDVEVHLFPLLGQFDHLKVAGHSGQDVVEIVGEATGQLSDDLHLLGELDLLLVELLFGDVHGEREKGVPRSGKLDDLLAHLKKALLLLVFILQRDRSLPSFPGGKQAEGADLLSSVKKLMARAPLEEGRIDSPEGVDVEKAHLLGVHEVDASLDSVEEAEVVLTALPNLPLQPVQLQDGPQEGDDSLPGALLRERFLPKVGIVPQLEGP
ncbi:MAG: hypothetical protein BWY86_00680 [Candidatus Aminicenantes bacterium ADurb.Bin508]|nr:MAG: hypothetical protein BWY86_00680 [Candidatus Aminicenantes bacterium ADurb.Bin508]